MRRTGRRWAGQATSWGRGALGAVLVIGSAQAVGQALPDAGQVLRESQQPSARLPQPEFPTAKVTKPPDDQSGPRVELKAVKVEGAQRYDDATLQAAIAPFIGQSLGFAGLQSVADAIVERYRADGWHAAATLPSQDLKDGVLRIVVTESKVGRVLVVPDELPSTVPRRLAQRYIDRAALPGFALNLDRLARATALANEAPGLRAGVLLNGGAEPGETDLQLRLEPRPVFSASASVDNQDALSTGSYRANGNAAWSSPAGYGEEYQFNGSASQGKRFGQLAATAPVGDAGWRVGMTGSWVDYKLVGDAAASLGNGASNGARGSAKAIALNASYPLWRGDAGSANLVFTQEHRNSLNETAAGVTSDKRVDDSSVAVQMERSDGWLGGGVNSASFSVTRGRIDLSHWAADLANDQLGPRTQGVFTRMNLSLSRMQRVDDRNGLWLSVSAQAADRNLDAGEKFSLGGAQGVRAYPLLEGSGDQAVLVRAAWRHQVTPTMQLEPFFDTGAVQRSKRFYSGSSTPNHYVLKGGGLGFDWAPANRWRVNAIVAQRVGANPGALPNGRDNDGSLRRLRAWVSVSWTY